MTNEDAIHILLNSNEHHHAIGDLPHSAASVEAFNKAIDALKNAERIDVAWQQGVERGFAIGFEHGKHERQKGEWINHRNDYGHNIADCSLCGKTMQWHDEDGDGIPRYCWYCGAPMKGVKTETKNPREGMDFNDYLAEQLKDPEFRKEWENVLKEEENGFTKDI